MYLSIFLVGIILITGLGSIAYHALPYKARYIMYFLILFIGFALFKLIGVEFFADVVATAFILLSILIGLAVNRTYIFMLMLLSIILMALLLILNMTHLAEYFATNVFLLLILAICKDLLHDKIFQN